MSRMDSIRNAAKIAGGAAVVGGGVAAYNKHDMGSSLQIGAGAGIGAAAGMAAMAGAKFGKGLPSAFRAGMAGSGMKGRASAFAGALGKGGSMSGKNMAIGALAGAGIGMGMATLKSNRTPSVDYTKRLEYDTKRKAMIVQENIRQMQNQRALQMEAARERKGE